MKKVITNYEEARNNGLLSMGKYFVIVKTGQKIYLPYYFGHRLDVENLEYALSTSDERTDLPDLNALVKAGIIRDESIYKEHDILPEGFDHCDVRRKLNDKAVDRIIKEFAEKGFVVTREAIQHNYCAWLSDRKSGYRDDENGVFLFTPCGCNPLRFSAMTIHEELNDWQQTYAG